MKLEIGQQAPDFTVEDVNGRQIRLRELEQKKILLCFFRYAGCPMCNYQLSLLIGHAKHFMDDGLTIIAFFQSIKKEILEFPAKQNPPFSLVADPDRVVYNQYGTESSYLKTLQPKNALNFLEAHRHGFHQPAIDGDFFLMPAEFLIGPPDGTIYKAHYWMHFADALPTEEIEKFIHHTPLVPTVG